MTPSPSVPPTALLRAALLAWRPWRGGGGPRPPRAVALDRRRRGGGARAVGRLALAGWALCGLAACGRGGASAELIVQVVEGPSGRPIPWAVVQVAGQSRRTSPAGLARFAPPPGSHALDVGAKGYQPHFGGHQLHPGHVAFRLIALDPVATSVPEPADPVAQAMRARR